LNLDLGDTHNIYVKILTEQGLVGFLIFVFLVICFMKEGFSLYQKGDDDLSKALGLGLGICMFVLAVNNMFGDRWSYFELSGYLWIFAGLVARLNVLAEEGSQGQPAAQMASVKINNVVPSKKIRKSYYK
jgi:O-antigen ligase